MCNCKLKVVTEEKDLGVCISQDLKTSQQRLQAYSKAFKLLQFSIVRSCVKIPLICCTYKSLIRPHLEFCTPAWSTYCVRNKVLIEMKKSRSV